jgi:tetratricopeptide (TPR) repeat protein
VQELKDGHYAKAEEAYRKIIVAHPKRAESYINLGKARFLQRKYQEAIEAFAQGRKPDPHLGCPGPLPPGVVAFASRSLPGGQQSNDIGETD